MSSVTIYDVAEAAGVSTATVSKVLSGQRYVSAKTRAKVLAAVERLHYVPNVAARGLAGARTHIVGVVISYDPGFLYSDPHMLQILQGAHLVAARHDSALLLSTGRAEKGELPAFQRLLGQRYVDGALVEGSLGEVGFALLRERGYPVVAIGYSEAASCVHSDDREGARLLTHHLIEQGHRRIGVISGPAHDRLVVEMRMAGYRDALAEGGIPFDAALVVPGTFELESGYQGAAALMARPEPPSALFAFNDRMAMGAIRWLHERGMRVPEEVAVAGFDDNPDAARHDPPLTTVRQLSQEQGQQAAALLFDLIDGASPPEVRREILLPTELIVRGSTVPAKGG